jgi:hypothetical protein
MDVKMPDGTIVRNVPDNITQTDLLARYNKFKTLEETKPSKPTVEIGPANLYQENKAATYDIPEEMPKFAQAVPESLRTPFTGSLVKGITGVKSSYTENVLAELMAFREADIAKYGKNLEKASEKEKANFLGREEILQGKFKDLAGYAMQNKAVEEAYGKPELAKKLDSLTAKPEYKDATGLQKTGMYLSTLGKNLDELPGYIANLGAESLPQTLSIVAVAAIANRAGLGTKGAAIGGGATSAVNEFGGAYAELRTQGMPHEEAWQKAAVKSGIIGIFDGVSLNSAGTAASKIIDGIVKKAPIKETVKEVGKETGKQALLGGAGEGLGSYTINQPFDPKRIGDEMLGEAFTAPLDAASTYNKKRAEANAPTTEPEFIRDEKGNLVPAPKTTPQGSVTIGPIEDAQKQLDLQGGEAPTPKAPFQLAGGPGKYAVEAERRRGPEDIQKTTELRNQFDTIEQELSRLQAAYETEQNPAKRQAMLVQAQKLDFARQEVESQLKAANVSPRPATPEGQGELFAPEQAPMQQVTPLPQNAVQGDLFNQQEAPAQLAPEVSPAEQSKQQEIQRQIFALQQGPQSNKVRTQIADLQSQLQKGPGENLDYLKTEYDAIQRALPILEEQRKNTKKLDDKLKITEQINQAKARAEELLKQGAKSAEQLEPTEEAKGLNLSDTINEDHFKEMGINKTNKKIRALLEGKSLSNPDDRAFIVQTLTDYASNPSRSAAVSTKVDNFLNSLKPVQENQNGSDTGANTGAVEPSLSLPNDGGAPSKGTTTPIPNGVESDIGSSVGAGTGTPPLQNVQSNSLEESKATPQDALRDIIVSANKQADILFGNQENLKSAFAAGSFIAANDASPNPVPGIQKKKYNKKESKAFDDGYRYAQELMQATPEQASINELSDYEIQQAEKKAQDAIPVGSITGTTIQKLKEFGKRLGSVRIHNHFQDSAKNKKILAAANNGDTKAALDELAKSKNPIYRRIASIAKNIDGLKVVVDDEKSEKQATVSKNQSDYAKVTIAIIDALREAKRRVDAGESLGSVGKDIIVFPKGLTKQVVSDQTLSSFLFSHNAAFNKDRFNEFVEQQEEQLEGYEDSNRALAGYSFEDMAIGGMYDPETNTVYLNSYWGEREGVFAHELAHAITHDFLNNPSKKNTPAYKAMENLYKYVKENFTGKEDEYGLTNIDEFVAEGFSNPMFQYELAKMKYENTSALSKFVDSVARILGLKNDNALTELLNIGFNEAEKGGSYKGAGSNFSLANGLASFLPEKLNKILNGYNYTNNETATKGYVTYISPVDFLKATTTSLEHEDKIRKEAGDLDREKLKKEELYPFLEVEIKDGQLVIVGHEGRHRMAALDKAGIKKVPVVIIPGGSRIDNAKPIPSGAYFTKQYFRNSKEYGQSSFFNSDEILPLSYDYAEQVKEKFSSPDAAVRFNLISTVTDAFKNWFGNSKVVDENGSPMRLYHGTTADISQFKLSSSGALGAGIYLTPDSDFASQYAQSQNANILPVYARIENPLVIKTVKGPSGQSDPMVSALITLGVDRAKAEKIVEKAYEEKGYITKEVMTRAQKQGYDGIFQYMNGELSEVVAFSPNQVKSVFNKNPTFGPKVLFNLKPSSEGEQILSNLKAAGFAPPKVKTGWFIKDTDDTDNTLNKSMLDKIKDFVGFGNFWGFDQSYMNVMRGQFLKLGNEGKIVMKDALDALRRVEITQVLYRGQLAVEAINTGKLTYDATTNRFKVVADPDNMDAVREQLKVLADRVKISPDDALAAASKGFEANRIQSIYDKMDKAKGEITRIEKKIQAKVDTEQNKKMLKKLKDDVETYESQTQHMTRQEAMEGMKIYNGVPEVQEIARVWEVMRKRVVDELVRSGVTSTEKAERWLDEMAYVPFFRTIEEQKAAGAFIYKKGLGESMKEYAFEGSMLPVENTIGNMYQWMQWSLSRAISNQHQQVALDQMRAVFPDMVKDGKDPRGNTFSIYRDGVKRDYTVANPLVAQYFMGVGNVVFGNRNIVSKWASLFTKGITLLPGFSATQLILRDTYEAMHTSGVKNPYGIITNIFQEMYKTATNTSEARKELISRGQLSTREHAMAASHDADIATKLEIKEAAIHSKLIGILGKFSALSDNLLRQAVYQQLRNEKVSEDEAASRAAEIFNYRRTSGNPVIQFLNNYVPFMNAFTVSTQVAMNTISGKGITAQTRGQGLSTLAQATILVGIGNLMYMMMVGDDEEYKRMNRYRRDKSYVIPGTGMSIPLREGLFIVDKLAAEYAYNLAMNSDVTDTQMFKDALKRAALQQITPPTPGIISAPAGAALNKDIYNNRDIVNVSQSKLLPEYQMNKDTSEFAKYVGKETGLSPLKIDYFFKTMLGGYMSTMTNVSNAYIADKMGKSLPAKEGSNVPLEALGFGPFLSKPGTPNAVPDLYAAAHEVDRTIPSIMKLAKAGRTDEARKLMQERKSDIAPSKEASKYQDVLNKYNRRELEIRSRRSDETVQIQESPFYGKPYTPEVKKAMIDELDKKRIALTPKVMELRKKIYER